MMCGNSDGRNDTVMYGIFAVAAMAGMLGGLFLGGEIKKDIDAQDRRSKSKIEMKAEREPARPYTFREAVAESDSCVNARQERDSDYEDIIKTINDYQTAIEPLR
jgi:hypothetical protein